MRISSIAIPKTGIADYSEYVRRDLIPRYKSARGICSIQVLERELIGYIEMTTISVWDSEELLTHFLETNPFDRSASEFFGIEFESRIYSLLISEQRPPIWWQDELG